MTKSWPLAAVTMTLLLTGCVSERVVLLPSADGHPGAVVVRDANGEQLIRTPYTGTVRRFGSNTPAETSADEVKTRFGTALAAQPQRPNTYLLYFEPGGNQLTEASRGDFERMCKEIAERPASEGLVIGHTDRVGAAEGNDALSKRRAEAIREQLIASGVDGKRLEAVGRGERDPLVPTADEVDEPRNRRVEIILR